MRSLNRTHRGRTLLLAVLVVAGTAYPMSADALTEQQKLTAPDPVPSRNFGRPVSLSHDGKTLLAVSRTGGCSTGYVFVRSGNTWDFQQTLTVPHEGQLCGVPAGGTLSGDGNTALIGDWALEAAWVFVRSGSTWTQQQKLMGGKGLGESVALSADGNTALVSAVSEEAAYVFVRNGTTWAQQQKLIAPDPPGTHFGQIDMVSLSSDGHTALMMASTVSCVSGYVFVRSGDTWGLEAELTALAPGTCEHSFTRTGGTLSGDGNTALIGNLYDNAWVFVRSGSTWTQQQKLVPLVVGPGLGFGPYAALTDDGNTALVGAYAMDCTAGIQCGAAYLFVRNGGTWTQEQKLTSAFPAGYDWFGSSVALSGDGDTALVGANGDDCTASDHCGAAYVFFNERKCKRRPGAVVIDPECFVQPPFKDWIPVGCEIIDCCPGCPGLDRIDWVIRVDGDPVEALILRFENLPPPVARRLRIEGEAMWLKGDRLQIKGQGETIIRGFMPAHSRDLRWSLLSPRMTLERIVAREGAERLGGQAGAPVQRTGTVRVRVEQKVGSVTINHSSLVYRYRQ